MKDFENLMLAKAREYARLSQNTANAQGHSLDHVLNVGLDRATTDWERAIITLAIRHYTPPPAPTKETVDIWKPGDYVYKSALESAAVFNRVLIARELRAQNVGRGVAPSEAGPKLAVRQPEVRRLVPVFKVRCRDEMPAPQWVSPVYDMPPASNRAITQAREQRVTRHVASRIVFSSHTHKERFAQS
jgi:hypothetical protein